VVFGPRERATVTDNADQEVRRLAKSRLLVDEQSKQSGSRYEVATLVALRLNRGHSMQHAGIRGNGWRVGVGREDSRPARRHPESLC
jgi:hypothetical protein